ncbi:ABC transporter substrate-binding protein (plasmid) [Polaromonas sp. P1-6]|nr:ABC transporter substrate-binding protein [Polaromonas sp. P1-6]
MLAGYQMAMQASGGRLALKVLDDESKPEKAAQNIKLLAADPSMLAVSGIVGTPHAQASLPVALQYELPIVGIRSGAQSLRNGKEGVYHLRATFEDELDKVAKMCKGGGLSKVAILYSNDSFGTSSRDHLVARLKELGLDATAAVAVERNGENLAQAAEKIAQAVTQTNAATGIALLLISKPMMQAATLLREKHKLIMPLFAMSFVATKGLTVSENPAFIGLGLVTAFPLPRSNPGKLATQYRTDALQAKQGDLIESLTAFEGYFYGSVIAESGFADCR